MTAFDRIEAAMAARYSTRMDGWPVGPEVTVPVWSCPSPTVQLIEHERRAPHRYSIWTLFPFGRAHLVYPVVHAQTLRVARITAFQRLRDAGDGSIRLGRPYGIDLARSGSFIGLECLR